MAVDKGTLAKCSQMVRDLDAEYLSGSEDVGWNVSPALVAEAGAPAEHLALLVRAIRSSIAEEVARPLQEAGILERLASSPHAGNITGEETAVVTARGTASGDSEAPLILAALNPGRTGFLALGTAALSS